MTTFHAELDRTIGFNAFASEPLHFLQAANAPKTEETRNEEKSAECHLLSIAGSSLMMSSATNPRLQVSTRFHQDNITACAVSPDRRLAATAEGGDAPDVVVARLSLGCAEEVFRLEEHTKGVAFLAFSDDNRLLASVGTTDDGRIIVWDMETGAIVTAHSVRPAKCADFSWGGRVTDMKGRPTTDYLFATCGGPEVRIWGLTPSTGHVVSDICSCALRRNFTCLAFSPTFELLLAGTNAGDFVVFDVKQLKAVASYQSCRGGVTSISCAPLVQYPPEFRDSLRKQYFFRILVGGGNGSLREWTYNDRLQKFVPGEEHKLEGSITALKNDNGYRLAVGTALGSIYHGGMDLASLQCLSCSETANVVGVVFPSGSSANFLTCGDTGYLKMWRASDYSVGLSHKPHAVSRATCVHMNEELIISGWESGEIRAFNAFESDDEIWHMKDTHKDGVSCAAISRNDKYIVSCGNNGSLRVWDLRYRQLIAHLKEHKQRVTGMALYHDSRHVLTCSKDRSFICWDLATKKSVSCHRQTMGAMNGIAMSPDEQVVVTAAQDKALTFWDIRQREPTHKISDAHQGAATLVAICGGDGKVMATAGADNMIRFWDMNTKKQLSEQFGHSSGVNDIAFSPDSRQLVSTGNGTIMVWNLYSSS